MARLTQIDYDREMAFIATASGEGGKPETLGVVRTVTDPNNEEAEYAIVVRSDLKGEGLGRKMMDKMIDYCRARGTKYYVGQVLRENRSMLGLAESLGFAIHRIPDEDDIRARLLLNSHGRGGKGKGGCRVRPIRRFCRGVRRSCALSSARSDNTNRNHSFMNPYRAVGHATRQL